MSDVFVGNINLGDSPIVLSPMAGTSTVTYRGICHEFGSSYAPTELCSARSIVYGGVERSFRFLEIDPETEGITAIQLFGNEPEDFAIAIDRIHEHPLLSQVSIIDINMGCPVSKVVKTGAGSALMKTPEIAWEIVRASSEALSKYGKPLTVKTRIGYEKFSEASLKFVEGLVDSGAQMICVHGRTSTQMYHGVADMDSVARMSEVVRNKNIPFFSNGDITDYESYQSVLEKTKCDGVMIGRAAMGNPWIFETIKDPNKVANKPDIRTITDMLLRELEGTSKHIGETTAVKEMRSVMPHYIKGIHGAAKLKVELCKAMSIDEVKSILNRAIEEQRDADSN